MYIIIVMLFIVNIIYVVYIKYIFFSGNKKSFPIQIYLYILFSTTVIWWMIYVRDIYYFYLFWETFNIMSYTILINLSTNVRQYKGVAVYYFLGFVASMLFVVSIYDVTGNLFSFYLINTALVLKFRLFPFSNVISYVYKSLGYIAFLTISYLLYFQYFIILIIFNFQNMNKDGLYSQESDARLYYVVAVCFCVLTVLAGVLEFDKQNDVKSFLGYSSILNLPIIILSLLSPTLNIIDFSSFNYSMLITYLTYYILFYSTNSFILSVHGHLLKPTKELRWLIGKGYYSSLGFIIQNFNPRAKFNVNMVLLVVGRFPPTLLFFCKYYIFLQLVANSSISAAIILVIINTYILYGYAKA